MTYVSQYEEFRFESFLYDESTHVLTFEYSFDGVHRFTETAVFEQHGPYDSAVFQKAALLAFVVAGISYYKTHPTPNIVMVDRALTKSQADFFSTVYRDGLSQFVYENGLDPNVIGVFQPNDQAREDPLSYTGAGISVLQSGGKDSLLLARLLAEKGASFQGLYMQQGESYPAVIDTIGVPVRRFRRHLDKAALLREAECGGLNGHVPVTFITLAYALVDTILQGGNTVLAAIGQEGEEPHAYIGDYAVTHQWSKTWRAEQMFFDYVQRNVSADLYVGSPLRGFAELKIAELFTKNCWAEFGQEFSSCNVANYRQGHNNSRLSWCGECPKCANSYLLFAAFVAPSELNSLFGRDLFSAVDLRETFKGLLGIDGVIKPFECVGEIDELRQAYWLARANGYGALSFEVPTTDFDIDAVGPVQSWAHQMIQ